MSEFTYHNIFETKGIEYILTIVFFLLLIPFWMLLNRKQKAVEIISAMQGVLDPAFLLAPKGLFYGKNHTWAFLERTGKAKVGINDFIVHLTGKVNIKLLKNAGDDLKKGDLFAEIEKDGKILRIFSPVSGKVMNANTELQNNPLILNNDPYGQGWLFEVEPNNWMAETQSYYMAEKAVDWLKAEFSRFKDFVIQSVNANSFENSQLVLQDGGELMDQTLKNMPTDVWENFQNEFLNTKA